MVQGNGNRSERALIDSEKVIFALHNVMRSLPTESLATIMLGSATAPSTCHAASYALDCSPANSYGASKSSLPSRIARLMIPTSSVLIFR